MEQDDLPQRWKKRLTTYLKSIGNQHDTLSAGDFPVEEVTLRFEDGSLVNFKYAFTIDAVEMGEVGVFTEHCGYHVFNRNSIDLP